MTDAETQKLIDELVSDRKKFDEFIYTPLDQAVKQLKDRWRDKNIKVLLSNLVNIPVKLRKEPTIALLRPICTPNFETHKFINIADALKIKAIIWEYTHDKFVPDNPIKYHLGKLNFFYGLGRNGGQRIEVLKLLDFTKWSGKPIRKVKALNGSLLKKIHRDIFLKKYVDFDLKNIIDVSNWYKRNGQTAKEYYKKLLLIFIRNSILFDNFLLKDKHEIQFIKSVFLPAFIEVYYKTGIKPLIVSLEPTDTEGSNFWYMYPPDVKDLV